MRGHRSVTVDLDVYIEDFDDVDVIEDVRRRGYVVVASPAKIDALKKVDKRPCEIIEDASPSITEEIAAIREAICDARRADAIAIIDRLLAPKYPNVVACKDAYEKRPRSL